MKPPNLIRKTSSISQFIAQLGRPNALILNIGSGGKRYGQNCLNLDIKSKPETDVVGDAHHLPFASSIFDFCILSAVLQYCREPAKVVREVHRVLKPGGYAIIDAPFVQPYCPDTPDLYRFTKYGLEHLFSDGFEVVENRVSIPGGSALAHFAQSMVLFGVEPRWLRGALAVAVSILLFPLALLKVCRTHEVAGAMVLVARKTEWPAAGPTD